MIVEKLIQSASVNKRSGKSIRSPSDNENEGGFNFLQQLFNPSSKKIVVENAHMFDDIYTCVNILSDDISKLPMKVFKKTDDQIESVKPKEHSVANLLVNRPNKFMNISDYKKLIMVDVLLAGNHYSLMEFDKDGQVKQFLPLPTTTQPVIDGNGILYYQTTINKEKRTLLNEEVIHVKGLTRDGIVGKTPISVIAERVEANETANDYNKTLLESGGAPKGILKVPGLLSKGAKEKAKDEWKRVNGRDAIAVIDSGLEYQQLGISNEDMQFIDSQKYNTQKIAAIYKIPLHKINEMGRATYSNAEQLSLDYVKNTLQPWVTRIEEEFRTKAFDMEELDEGYYIKLNLDSELRGDSKTRAEVNKIEMESGGLTIDEMRAFNERSAFNTVWSQMPFITLNWTQADNLVRYQNAKAKVTKIDEKEDNSNVED